MKTTLKETILNQKYLEELSKAIINMDFVDWYEKGFIDKEECDFYMAIYDKTVNKFIKSFEEWKTKNIIQ